MSILMRRDIFNLRRRPPRGKAAAGFTLLEVMIAVAVIALALVTLLGAQSQSVSIASGLKFDTMASMLAQQKLSEVGRQKYEGVASGNGDFGREFPGFMWSAKVAELTEAETGIKGAGGMLKVVDLTIAFDQDASLLYTARTIVCKQLAAAP